MKIKKMVQGSIPSNKVFNSHNTDKHNAYSTEYLNDKLVCVSLDKPTDKQKFWIQTSKNLFHDGLVTELGNITYNHGLVVQKQADSNSNPNWKCQGFQNNKYVVELASGMYPGKTGVFSFTFTKTSAFNNVRFGVNGSQIDTTLMFRADHLTNGETYTLSFNILNITQGSFSWNNIQLENGFSVTAYESHVNNKIYVKRENDFYEEIYDEGNFDVYSTVEHRAGTWITGKPLYKRLFSCGSHAGNSVEINIPVDIYNLEYVHKLEAAGTYYDVYFLPLPYNDVAGKQACQVFFKGGSDNTIGINSNIALKDIIVTLYYTKTTD